MSPSVNARRLSFSIALASVYIGSSDFTSGSGGWAFSFLTRRAMFTAASPTRSRLLLSFIVAITCRKSDATGWKRISTS